MEFNFDVNNLFGSEISKLDSKLIPFRNCPGSRQYKEQLHQVVDQMGEASAKAQGLRGAITAADKMRHTDQLLYVIKEPHVAENSRGCVVGILKIGHKKLFVYDNHGLQHEVEPLCVLDFYVHESRQRKGCGRRLFDHMLQDQNMKAQHLAIDRPSHKFAAFLQKHYHLKATIPQVNNFTIFSGFFHDRTKKSARGSGRKAPLFLYNSPRTNSNEFKKTANLQQQKEALQNVTARHNNPAHSASTDPASHTRHSTSGGKEKGQLVGMQSLYSRHQLNPASPLPDIGQPKVSSANSLYGRKVPSPPAVVQNPSVYQDRRGHLKLNPPPSHQYAQPAPQPSSQPTNHPHVQSQSQAQQSSRVNAQSHSQPNSRPNSLNQAQNHPSNQPYPQSKSRPSSINVPAGQQNGLRSNLNAYEKQILAMEKERTPNTQAVVDTTRKDALLPAHFTPYADLKLPPPDPYARRAPSQRALASDTSWKVFGMANQQPATGYASPDRFKNTRPW